MEADLTPKQAVNKIFYHTKPFREHAAYLLATFTIPKIIVNLKTGEMEHINEWTYPDAEKLYYKLLCEIEKIKTDIQNRIYVPITRTV